MPISRHQAVFLHRRLAEAQNTLVKAMCDRPKVTIRPPLDPASEYPEESGHTAEVNTDLRLDVIDRARLLEVRESIDEALKLCVDDRP